LRSPLTKMGETMELILLEIIRDLVLKCKQVT
jgi:hypothetical protein